MFKKKWTLKLRMGSHHWWLKAKMVGDTTFWCLPFNSDSATDSLFLSLWTHWLNFLMRWSFPSEKLNGPLNLKSVSEEGKDVKTSYRLRRSLNMWCTLQHFVTLKQIFWCASFEHLDIVAVHHMFLVSGLQKCLLQTKSYDRGFPLNEWVNDFVDVSLEALNEWLVAGQE